MGHSSQHVISTFKIQICKERKIVQGEKNRKEMQIHTQAFGLNNHPHTPKKKRKKEEEISAYRRG
jgi:hypothetical protein